MFKDTREVASIAHLKKSQSTGHSLALAGLGGKVSPKSYSFYDFSMSACQPERNHRSILPSHCHIKDLIPAPSSFTNVSTLALFPLQVSNIVASHLLDQLHHLFWQL